VLFVGAKKRRKREEGKERLREGEENNPLVRA